MNVNKVILCGYLPRDPELRYSSTSSTPIASFDVATNRYWNDEKGERQSETEYHHIVAFGTQAQTAVDYLAKGRVVLHR